MNINEIKQTVINNENASTEYINGFIDALDIFKNNLWHDNTEIPSKYASGSYPQIPCIVYGYISTGYGYGIRYWNTMEHCWDSEDCDDYECEMNNIEKWAYLNDLIYN